MDFNFNICLLNIRDYLLSEIELSSLFSFKGWKSVWAGQCAFVGRGCRYRKKLGKNKFCRIVKMNFLINQ